MRQENEKWTFNVSDDDFITNYVNIITSDAEGNVGIGETSPSRKLHVKDSGNIPLRLETTETTNLKADICLYPSDPNGILEAPRGSLCIVPFSTGTPPAIYMNHTDGGPGTTGKQWKKLAQLLPD
jgi:hypothetical protein